MGRPSTSYETSCKTCGKIFFSKVSQKRKFCSRICYVKRDNNLSLNAKCGYCKKKFHVKPSKFKWGKGKYCSKKCYGNSQKDSIQLECHLCNKSFIAKRSGIKKGRKYCSNKCSQIAHRGNGSGRWVKSVKLTCEFCKKIFYMKPWETRNGERRFCSASCQYESNKGENHPSWLGGISFEPYGIEFNEKLKEKIRQRDNYTCQINGCNEKQNGKRFPVHHVDYCKQNNEEYNLITLCPSHHNRSNFNRDYWENYFKATGD